MTYLLLIYSDESQMPPPPQDPAAVAAMMAPWKTYTEAMRAAGVHRGGDALMPTHMATTVSASGGEAVITDGPFAETREQLGGFYAVECADLDEALKWAGQCPILQMGGRVEVRPVMPTMS